MNNIADIAVAIVVVAGILVLTRPGSQGPTLVENLTSGFGNAVGIASGGVTGSLPYAKG